MSNYVVPVRPNPGAVRHIADILTDFDYVTARMDEITNQRRLIHQAEAFIPNALATGTYFIAEDGTLVVSAGTTSKAIKAAFFSWGNLTISPAQKALSLVMRCSVAPNGVSPATFNISCRLIPVTWSGPGTLIPTAGAFVVSVPFSAAELAAQVAKESAPVAIPIDGYYALGFQGLTAAAPATFCASITMQLFVVES